MNRAQFAVIVFGLVLASFAVLFPYWSSGAIPWKLSYWEQVDYRGWSVTVPSTRACLFTGPKKPTPSQPNARITHFSPKLQIAQLITEVSFIAALTALLVWMLRTSPIVTKSAGKRDMFLAHAALALYIFSLALPAINYAATPIVGWQAVRLSFIGAPAVLGFQHEKGQADACLIGAFANLLFVSAYVTLLARPYLPITRPSVGSRTYKASVFMACVAAAGTLGVLVPLAFGSESFRVSIGYMLWVGSAALLVFAARRLSISDLT